MKTKTVSPITKFLHWQYSGLIVVPTACALILLFWFYSTSQAEFFDYWSCETIKNYMMDIDVPDDITPHNDLTEQQHLRLHELLAECNDFQRFSEPFSHP
jgi:hypothetical protein